MISDIELFKKYTNIFDNEDLIELYLSSAENIVEQYLNRVLSEWDEIPGLVKLTIFRIAALITAESGGNIGITSKSMTDGSRTFIKTTDYSPYLQQIARWVNLVEEENA